LHLLLLTLTYGTYLGGSGADFLGAMAVDAAGDVYLSGWTESANFPTASIRPRQGGIEAFVMKVSPAQNRVVWATYLGGSMDDRVLAIAVDSSGGVRVAGFTTSPDFPAVSAAQPHTGGGARDAFVARLDANGALVFATYLGGSGSDTATAIALTPDGSAWVAGETSSTNFPVAFPRQRTNAGLSDAFVTLIGPTGALLSSSYLGGAADDRAAAVAVDSGGAVYVGGATKSPGFPAISAVQAVHGGGQDGFVTKLDPSGSSILYSTFLGGADRDTPALPEVVNDIAVLADGSIVIAGTTCAMNFPVVKPLQPSFGGGSTDAFFARLSAAGTLLFSTYWGGPSSDEGQRAAVQPDGRVYLAGMAASTNLPEIDGFQIGHRGAYDAFVLKLNGALDLIFVSSYFGGPGSDSPAGIAIGGSSVYLAGNTDLGGLFGQNPSGLFDLFLARFQENNYSVTIGSSAAGMSFTVAGSGCSGGTAMAGAVLEWTPGAVCTVSFAPLQLSGGSYQVFQRWHDGSTTNPRVFTVTPGIAVPTIDFAPCVYSTTPSWSGVQSSTGASISASVSTPAGCPWTSAGSPAWVHLSAASGTGSASVAITVDANSSTSPRAAQITLGSTILTISQAGYLSPCAIATSAQSFAAPNSGLVSTLRVTTTPAGCAWTASTAAPWVQVYPLSGSGDRTLDVTVYPHFGTSVRAASIAVNTKVVPVSQAQGAGTYNQRFAGMIYFNFFGRLASTPELALQAGVLDGGRAKADLVNDFFQTAEFNLGGRFVAGLYVGMLNRDAEYSGWLFQRNALSTGIVNPNQLLSNFIGGAEYKLAYGEPDDQGFVKLLYRYVLLREAAQAEVEAQVGALRSGLTRVQLANNFLNSGEFRNGTGPRLTAFVLYACVLLRGPDVAERDNVIAELRSGATPKQIIERLLGSAEFVEVLK
jgi:hypothetical protein